jgi:hypothetical protein
MKHRETRLFGKGVRDLCDAARSWCAKLETLSSATGGATLPAALARAFVPVFAGALPRLDVRGWALLLINAIRQLIARLLDEETLHKENLAAVSPVSGRRNAATRELYRKLKAYRQLELTDRRGPVVPAGRLPVSPDPVAVLAAAVRPRLDCPDLKASFDIQILPSLRPDFDQATAELAAASADYEEARKRSREALAARNATIEELRVHVAAARSLHQAVSDLQALDPAA